MRQFEQLRKHVHGQAHEAQPALHAVAVGLVELVLKRRELHCHHVARRRRVPDLLAMVRLCLGAPQVMDVCTQSHAQPYLRLPGEKVVIHRNDRILKTTYVV